VIPDGQLHNLPFECLQDAAGRYLVESHIVSYAPSATALYLLKGEHRSHAPELAYLGVGGVPYRSEAVPPNGESMSGHIVRAASRGLFDLAGLELSNLPGSRDEVIDTSRILAQPSSVLLTGSQATEAAFKHEPLGDFKIIHLAVHAYESPGFDASFRLSDSAMRNEARQLQWASPRLDDQWLHAWLPAAGLGGDR